MRITSYWIVLILMGAWSYGQAPPDWAVNPHDFQNNMTVTAVLYVDGLESAGTDNKIAAFAGSECRGVAQPLMTNGRAMYFLLIYGHNTIELITLKVYCPDPDTVLNINESLNFEPTTPSIGQPDNPFIFHSILTVGINHWPDNGPVGFKLYPNYPNPFNCATTLVFTLPEKTTVRLEVFNLTGNLVAELCQQTLAAGMYRYGWSPPNNLASGVYFFKLTAGAEILEHNGLLIK